MKEVFIRPATATDVEAALDLIDELFDPPGIRPAAYERTAALTRTLDCITSDRSDALLAVGPHGEPIGLATVYVDVLSIREGRRCWVEEMVVSKQLRSHGVGTALLRAADEWGRAHGCSHLQLHSGLGRMDAHRFYLKQGMTQVAYVFSRSL